MTQDVTVPRLPLTQGMVSCTLGKWKVEYSLVVLIVINHQSQLVYVPSWLQGLTQEPWHLGYLRQLAHPEIFLCEAKMIILCNDIQSFTNYLYYLDNSFLSYQITDFQQIESFDC